jgi:hypothetical protein
MRSLLFCDVTLLRSVVITDVLGQPIVATFKIQEIQEESFPKRRQITTNLRCITSQKNEDLIYTATEARSHIIILILILCIFHENNKKITATYFGYGLQPYTGVPLFYRRIQRYYTACYIVKGNMYEVNIVLKY